MKFSIFCSIGIPDDRFDPDEQEARLRWQLNKKYLHEIITEAFDERF